MIAMMKIVECIEQTTASHDKGPPVTLDAGQQYVVWDREAASGVKSGVVRVISDLDQVLPPYEGQPLGDNPLLALLADGLGDSIIVSACLQSLKKEYPQAGINIACPTIQNELFEMLKSADKLLPHPLPASQLKGHAYHTSLEKLDDLIKGREFKHQQAASNLELFGRCLHTPPAQEVSRLKLPDQVLAKYALGPAQQPRVGIALTPSAHRRSYPSKMVLELTELLLGQGLSVIYLGRSQGLDCQFPHSPPWIANLLDKTPQLEVLAAVLQQLHFVVTPDAMIMHLAGVLHVPTLALFTSSPATVAGGYPTVEPLWAQVDCSPCGSAADQCPKSHPACLAPQHHDMQPAQIAERVLKIMQRTHSVPQ